MNFYKITLAFILTATLISPVSVSAATNAGIKPGSFWYGFEIALEKVNLFFTFNPEKKARKALEYADERLAEIEAVAEEKNPDAVKTAIANYESNVALATEKSKEVKDKGQAENLLASIEDSASKNQEILSTILIKVPDEAKQAITQAIEASKKGQEEATKQIAELKGEVEKLKKEVADLKAKDEAKTKASEELKKQKSESSSAPAKSSAPSASETSKAAKPVNVPAPQAEEKKNNAEEVVVSTPLPDIHKFELFKVNPDCSIQESGALICNISIWLKYLTGKDSASLKRPEGVSINASIPSLNNFNQKVTTSGGGYVGDEQVYATFHIPVIQDGVYRVTFSANGTTFTSDLMVDYMHQLKDDWCRDYGAFCDSKETAFADMTPRLVKVIDKKEISPFSKGEIIGSFKLVGIANSKIKTIKFYTALPLALEHPCGKTSNDFQAGTYTLNLSCNILSNTGNTIAFRNTELPKPNSYTSKYTTFSVIIEDIEIYGNETGIKKIFSDLPLIFTLTYN